MCYIKHLGICFAHFKVNHNFSYVVTLIASVSALLHKLVGDSFHSIPHTIDLSLICFLSGLTQYCFLPLPSPLPPQILTSFLLFPTQESFLSSRSNTANLHVPPLLSKFQWLPICCRIMCKLLIKTHKDVKNIPAHLSGHSSSWLLMNLSLIWHITTYFFSLSSLSYLCVFPYAVLLNCNVFPWFQVRCVPPLWNIIHWYHHHYHSPSTRENNSLNQNAYSSIIVYTPTLSTIDRFMFVLFLKIK